MLSVTNVPTPVVILDRDGTVVIDKHYLGDPQGLEFMPGAVAGLRKLHALGCKLIIVTNQSGVGRGILTLEQVERVNAGLAMMMDTIGAPLTATYFCPHAPDANCVCRKPSPGLLLQAAADHGYDPATCVVIGDKSSDVAMGRRVGAFTMLVETEHADANTAHPDAVVNDLNEAASIIQQRMVKSAAH